MFKRLSNLGEQRVYEELKPTADRYGAEVYHKVRVADVIDIDPKHDAKKDELCRQVDLALLESICGKAGAYHCGQSAGAI